MDIHFDRTCHCSWSYLHTGWLLRMHPGALLLGPQHPWRALLGPEPFLQGEHADQYCNRSGYFSRSNASTMVHASANFQKGWLNSRLWPRGTVSPFKTYDKTPKKLLTFDRGMLACLARFIVLMKYRAEVLIPFNTMTIVGWCIIEPSAYFIAACLPPCSSIMMIVLGNRHVRGVFSRRTKSGTMASPGSRPSRYPRLSSKPLSGFSHLVDSEDSPRGRPRPSFSAPTSPRSPFKDSRHAVDSKASQPDVPLQDISGIGIRTDIYVTESERQSAQDNLSLPDMLGSGSA